MRVGAKYIVEGECYGVNVFTLRSISFSEREREGEARLLRTKRENTGLNVQHSSITDPLRFQMVNKVQNLSYGTSQTIYTSPFLLFSGDRG